MAKLISIQDLRPVDWGTGKRVPLPLEDQPECQRCGRRHQVVWTVEHLGRTMTLGCRCGNLAVQAGELDILPGEIALAKRDKRSREQQAVAAAREAALAAWVPRARAALEAAKRPPIERHTTDLGLEFKCGREWQRCILGTDEVGNARREADAMRQLVERWRRSVILGAFGGLWSKWFGNVGPAVASVELLCWDVAR